MFRRSLAITVFVVLTLACAAAPALAYEATDSYVVDQHARLVEGSSQAVYMWPAAGGADLMAARVLPGTGQAGPYAVVTGIIAPGAWYAAGDGLNVTVVWKDGASVYVTRMDLSTPGGAYVWCTLSVDSTETPAKGNTLMNHVSATGVLAEPAPGTLAANGTIAGMAAVGDGDALALLVSPGRTQVAARRYAADLAAEWTQSPYLVQPSSVAPSQPVGVVGGADAAIAWREGGKVKVQRFTDTGSRRFLSPPAVTMAGSVKVAADGSGGFYLVAPSVTGLVARHVLVSGLQASWDPSTLTGVWTTPLVYGLANNKAGDLFVVSGDGNAGAVLGVSLLTYLGSWTDVGPASAPEWYPGVVPDGAGGAWAMGNGGNAKLWRISNVADQLTFRPRTKLVTYGRSITVSGYMTAAGGLPVHDDAVRIGTGSGDQFSVRTTAQTGTDGFYSQKITPRFNADWSAAATAAATAPVTIRVMPRVTLKLAHRVSGTRLTEIFSGSVAPNHAGKRVLVQKAVGSGWRTVASGRLDRRSHYRVGWRLPYRTATYKVRVVLRKHSDHAEGASPTGTVRIRVRKG